MTYFQKLAEFFVGDCLPVWAEVSFDGSGHFSEALSLDGTAEPTGVLRTRTAARQIYVFAHAAHLGVAPPGALEKAERAFQRLHEVAWIAGDRPGYARSFNRFSGVVLDPVRDLYDHACVLLALAWLGKASGNPAYGDHVDRTLAAMDVTLAAPSGGWAEDDLGTIPRRQNPHMHYFEACLALWETDGAARYVERAERLAALFVDRFVDPPAGPLREYFGPHWEVDAAFGSDRLEPGHMCEWVWLLRRHAAFTKRYADGLCEALLDTALAISGSAPGFSLVDEASIDGTALKDSQRLWPQVELFKAHVAQYRATGRQGHLDAAKAVEEQLFRTFLTGAPRGCWRDRFTLDGKFVADTIPASSLYHLWTAVAEIIG